MKTIIDNFDNLDLSGPKIHCTYCWQAHYGDPTCGQDTWRYLDNRADYLAYIQQYQAAGGAHAPLARKLRMEMRNQILQGDIIDVIKLLFPESINCIVTSPPYFGLRDYGLPPTHWPEVAYAPMAGLSEITIPSMTGCLGLEDSIEAYVAHMILVFRELWRVLRGDGVAWLNLGDSYASSPKGSIVIDNSTLSGSKTYQANGTPPNLVDKTKLGLSPKNLCLIPARVALALQADGWYVRSDVIWHKKNGMPESCEDRPTKAHEYIFLLAKSERYYYDQDAIRETQITQSLDEAQKRAGKGGAQYDKWEDRNGFRGFGGLNKETINYNPGGRNKRTVWSLSSQSYKGAHFAVIPESLVEPCLLAGCPARVCLECGEPWVRVVEREPKEAFTPNCQCSAPTRPGIALDPFFGSGTVGVVATRLKRDWLGIELKPDYIELARDRLYATQPALFAR